MKGRGDFVRILFSAVDYLNERLPVGSRLEKSEKTAIAGDSSTLESLEFVNLVLDYESRVGEAFGAPVSIAERLVGDDASGPPATLGDLADLAARACSERQ